MKRTAAEVREGDTVTYCGETFLVDQIQKDEHSGLLRFAVAGAMPQYVAPEREVAIDRPRPIVLRDPKPYKVLTRFYRPSGFCEKRRHEFATKKAQQSFMDRTKRAVTFYTI